MSLYVLVCLKMFHGQNVYFARSNHDDDADDDDDGDGDTPPRESCYTRTHNEPNTTGTFTWREIFNLPPKHTCMDGNVRRTQSRTEHDNDDGKTFGK